MRSKMKSVMNEWCCRYVLVGTARQDDLEAGSPAPGSWGSDLIELGLGLDQLFKLGGAWNGWQVRRKCKQERVKVQLSQV